MELLPKIKFYFHPDEKYFPCSFNYFVDNSKLYDKYDRNLGKKDSQFLSFLSCEDRKEFVLKSENEDIIFGFSDLNQIPIYFHEKKIDNKILVTLFLFYAFNGPYNILGIQNAGEHWGDIERIVFLIENNEITNVYFGSHGDTDGRWLKFRDLEKEDDSIVIYIAKNGHGFYPKEGVFWRIYGLANDFTKKGKSLIAKNFIKIPTYQDSTPRDRLDIGLVYFCGQIGENGISSFFKKDWFDIPISLNPPIRINNKIYTTFLILLKIILILLFSSVFIYGSKIKNNTNKYIFFSLFFFVFLFIIASIKRYIQKMSQ